eukprot:UN12520
MREERNEEDTAIVHDHEYNDETWDQQRDAAGIIKWDDNDNCEELEILSPEKKILRWRRKT